MIVIVTERSDIFQWTLAKIAKQRKGASPSQNKLTTEDTESTEI